jgi:diaminopimelate epimerase
VNNWLQSAGHFSKYHALGNDYLVVDGPSFGPLDATRCRQLCARHRGVGADGILVRQKLPTGELGLQIYNSDGSLAEKSGNGLRIFLQCMQDEGILSGDSAQVVLEGVSLRATLRPALEVEIGRPSFSSQDLHVAGPPRSLIQVSLPLAKQALQITGVSLGNPHCVVFVPQLEVAQLHEVGPQIESHPWFTQRTNVQFCRVLARDLLEILIWERGVGVTSASGSSSCAAVAAAIAQGACDAGSTVRVRMPGGELQVRQDADEVFWLSGPVEFICRGAL